MKKAFFCSLLFSIFAMIGCNSASSTSASQTPQTPAGQAPEDLSPAPIQNEAAGPALEWRGYLLDESREDIVARFDKAQKLVRERKGNHGKFSTQSKYFGDWFVIEIEPPELDPEMISPDAPSPTNSASLVDLDAEKLIDMGDWKAAKPFIDALVFRFGQNFESDKKRESFLAQMASAASVIAFGHTRYIEPSGSDTEYPEFVTGPSFKGGMDSSELVYYIGSSGMMRVFTRCTLTVTKTSVAFNAEIVGLEE